MTNDQISPSFRENIYNVIVQALDYSEYKVEGKAHIQIRHWIDEELQQLGQETAEVS